MGCVVDVISIGALSRNPFWEESGPVRPAHATCTLIRDGDVCVLVDPAIPGELLAHRLGERAGIGPEAVDAVFLTCFLPTHRRGLSLFGRADWLIDERERTAMLEHLEKAVDEVSGPGQPDVNEVEEELALLRRTSVAPDKLSESVHLFPSPGVTPGTCGLLIAGRRTTVVAGDAVISRAHYEHGRVHDRCFDAEQARESFAEIVELAEIIIPGHDNVIVAV